MSTNEDCFAIGQYKCINGAIFSDYNLSTIHFKMRLNDGMSVAFHVWSPSYSNFGNTESLSHAFSAVDVDINGDKGPNTYEKICLVFMLQNMEFFPMEHLMILPILFQIVKHWGMVVLLGL